MPASDGDAPFVAALLVSRNTIAEVGRRSRSVNWLVCSIRALELRPSIAYVKPRPGFAKTWAAKTDLMDTMARARRLVTGRHDYLPQAGMPRRNHVWIRATQQALLQSTLSSLFVGPVVEVTLVLDRKTMADETERFMRDRVDALIPLVKDQLLRLRSAHPEHAAQIDGYYENLQATCIKFEWGSPEKQAGLWLSHHLAWLTHRELMGQNKKSLFDALTLDGHRHFCRDVTDNLLQPITDEAIENWKRATGLPVPKI
ncbi:MAG: hypothetical protein KGL31_04470 [candidate division NC10 bacterium]|nr:hypothetical protein [candidate division NC10 bacterium]MDE2321156.1 hypothetical protein [candidate division NC10 bacterium]